MTTSTSTTPVDLAHTSATCAFGSSGPLALVLWRDITPHELRLFADYSTAVVSKNNVAYAALSIVAPRLRPPAPEVRAAIVALTKEGLNTNYKGATTVMLGEGFFASVARAALAGLALAGGAGMPDHVSKTIDEGADYCARILRVDVAALRAGAHEFYARANATT